MPAARKILFTFLLTLFLLPVIAAAQARPNDAAPISAEALEYGQQLLDHTDPALLKWAEEYVKKQFRWEPPNLDRVLDAVDSQFPAYAGRSRDAISYLVFYLAYRDQTKLAENFMRHLQDNASEARTIHEELTLWRDHNIQPSGMSGHPPGARDADDEAARMAARLRDLETESMLRANQLVEIRQRVNFTLFVLDKAHSFVRKIHPTMVQNLRP